MALVGDADGRFRAQPTVQMVDFTKLVREIELVGEHSIPRAQLPRLPRQGLEHGVLLQRACQRRALRLRATLSVASGFLATKRGIRGFP